MDRIESFQVDHLKLLPGVYVSRRDFVADNAVTTFDLRMKRPNFEPVMDTAPIHAIEHLGATFLRNNVLWKDKIIYFGPMGCRTGFYLIVAGDYRSEDILPLVTEMYDFIKNYSGEIPGASARECGNYLDLNLNMAKYEAERYLDVLLGAKSENLNYRYG